MKLTGIGGTCITGAEAITRVQRVADGTDTICTAVQVIGIGSFDAASLVCVILADLTDQDLERGDSTDDAALGAGLRAAKARSC